MALDVLLAGLVAGWLMAKRGAELDRWVMMAGYLGGVVGLLAGGNPNEHETFLILVASFITGGLALGLLAEKRDRAERSERQDR